jgi:hypothetical protein
MQLQLEKNVFAQAYYAHSLAWLRAFKDFYATSCAKYFVLTCWIVPNFKFSRGFKTSPVELSVGLMSFSYFKPWVFFPAPRTLY